MPPSALARALSPRSWPFRLVVAVLAPRLPVIAITRAFSLPGGELQRAVEDRLLSGVASFLALLAIVRLLERRTLRDTGLFALPGLGRRLAAGLALGALPMLGHAALLAAAGLYVFSWPGGATLAEAAGLAAVLLVVAVDEEIRFRGLVFRIADEGAGSWAAMAASGLLFGLLHAGNAGATPLGVVVVSAGGVMLAALYLLHRSLWIPIGFHLAWNVTMGVLLGLPVSGARIPSLLRASATGDDLWTGGRFGPEASMPIAAFVVVATSLVVWRAGARGKLTPAPWRG
jgi:membrane protease YdiL (CAAX protease family)